MARPKKEDGLSEYEQQRQEKIAKNQALLQQLQLDAAQTGIAPKSKPKPASTAGQKRKKPATQKIKEEDNAPRRTSSRLKGIVADSEVARQKQEAENEAFQEQQKAKRQRVSGDINLTDAVVNGRTWNKAGNWLTAVGPAQPGERTFDAQDVRDTTDKELRELRERLSSLQLWEGWEPNRIKITPERIYSLGFHPSQEKPLVFAGDKLGSLGLFDGSQTNPETIKNEDDEDDDAEETEPAISTFKIHTRTISAFQFSPHDSNALYSCSYDSSIRRLDLIAGAAIEAYAPADTSEDAPLSGVEISSTDPNLLHFTTLDGRFGLHDLRTPTSETVEIFQLSEKKIGGFSLHPSYPHLVATASLDRHMRVYDLRKITGKGEDRVPHMIGEHLSSLSVSHAAWNAAGQVATASYDDTVKIYDFSEQCGKWANGEAELGEEEMLPSTIVPHNNQTGRWVTILRAQWQLRPPGGVQRFVIGNMNRECLPVAFASLCVGRSSALTRTCRCRFR